jgi:hypothetical protein
MKKSFSDTSPQGHFQIENLFDFLLRMVGESNGFNLTFFYILHIL